MSPTHSLMDNSTLSKEKREKHIAANQRMYINEDNSCKNIKLFSAYSVVQAWVSSGGT